MVEKVIFFLLAVCLFIITFAKLIRKNDTSYINFLAIQFLGILLTFMELIFKWNFNIFFKALLYLFSIVIPIVIIIIEKKNISIPEGIGIIKAKIFLALKKTEESKQILLKIVGKYPKSYISHKMLAEIYEKNNQISTAIEEYVRAVEINLKDYNSYFRIAKLLNENNKIDESITMLKNLLKKKPDFYEATELLGDIYYDKEMFRDMISIYLDAQKYNPAKYEIYYNLGMAYTRLNDFQRANEYYAKAAEINSLLFNGIFNMGQIAMLMSELEEAEKYFLDSLQGEDVESGSYYYLAQIAMMKGDKDKAVNYLNLAIELDLNMYEKVKENIIFASIIKQVKVSYDQVRKMSNLERKEKATQDHLYNMYNLIGSMSQINKKPIKSLNKKIEKEDKIIE